MTTPNPRPSFPTEEKHFHPFAALRFLRKTLAVYLIPLVNVLFERNWPAFWTALRQDAILFALLCGVSWVILRFSSWQLDEAGVLHLRWKLLFKLDTTIRGEALAALTLERPALFRLGGATKITLYPTGQPRKHVIPLCLRRADARELADRLLPIETPTLHTPAGSEQAALVLLGANGISTLALVALAIRQTRQLPLDAETLAFAHLGHLAAFAARWLPAGAAWLLTLATALFGASLARSFAQAMHYEVWHTATQIGSRGGWIDRFECRVRSAQISYADVRVSPVARLLRRWPVFVTAGCCTPELPLFVYRSGGEALFRELLPEFQMPPDVRADTTQRSLIFFAPAGIPFALCALLSLVSVTVLPAMTVTLLVPTVFFFVLLCGAVMGYTREGIWLREGKVTLRRQEGVYLHCICVFHPDLCLMGFQSPWAANVRRTTLTLIFPGQVRLKVRSIPLAEANAVVRFLEQESGALRQLIPLPPAGGSLSTGEPKIQKEGITMIKTILFDLDGTLLNTIDDLADAANWVCAQNGWPTFSVETYKHFVGNGIPKLVERFSPESARTPEQLAATLAAFSARYDAHKEDKTAPYPGMAELLDALQAEGIQTAVFSNKADEFCGKIVEHYFGKGKFTVIRGSRKGVPTKPDPAGVYALMQDIGADPKTTLFIGDSDVDILTGHNAHLPAMGVLWGFRGEAELTAVGADALARTPEDILDYLHKANR